MSIAEVKALANIFSELVVTRMVAEVALFPM